MVLPGALGSRYLDSGTLLGVSKLREIHAALKIVRGGEVYFLWLLHLDIMAARSLSRKGSGRS
jgi:hypothetical protein